MLLAGGRAAAARAACHALGRPARDARPARGVQASGRRSVHAGYAAGETPNPCMRCNGAFRFDALVAFAERAGPRSCGRATTRGSSSATACGSSARARRRAEGPVVHARGRRSDAPRARALSARRADEGRDAGGGRARGPRGARRAREPGGVLPRRRRLPRVPRASGGAAAPGAIVDEDGATIGCHDGYWRFTPGQRRGLRVPRSRAALRAAHGCRDEHGRRRARASARDHARSRRRAGSTRPSARAEAKLRYRSPPIAAAVDETDGGFALELDEPAYGVAPGQVAASYDGDAVVGAGVITAVG